MKKQNEKRCGLWGKIGLMAALCMVAATLFLQASVDVYAQGTAKVTAGSGKIRASASTSSEVIASVQSGDKLDVIAQTTDSEGYTWYKVYVNGNQTGYIRADLVGDVSGSIETESASDSGNNDNASDDSDESSSQQVQFVQVNESTATAGKVTGGDTINVRENPSTDASVAGKANRDTQVVISGEAVDADGKLWYQVSFDDVSGFIRSDFLEVTQTAEEFVEEPVEESVEETVEEPVVEEPVVNQDYEVIYEMNAEGEEEWFLYDYTRGTKQSVENLLAVVRQNQQDGDNTASQLKTFKLVTIVMVAVILVLIIIVTVLIFKLRDSYEYEYEDDDYDDDEDDDDDERYEGVGRRTTAISTNAVAAATSERRMSGERTTPVERSASVERTSTVERTSPVETPQPAKKETSSMSKNFLDIDDDMEFEFLDLK